MENLNPIVFAGAFIVFWLAMIGGIAFASGWRMLAARFASDRPVHGEDFRFARVAFARGPIPVGYNGCVFANVGSSGIALSLLFLFRFMHPRLFIPWPEIESCVPQKYWMMDVAAVGIRGFDGKVMFQGALGRKILNSWNTLSPALSHATFHSLGARGRGS